MFNSLKIRFLFIGGLLAVCAWMLYQRGITLGLDLRGGTHLALEVKDSANALDATQRADAIDRALQIIRTRVNELGVAEPKIQKVGQERIVVELPGADSAAQSRARDVIQRAAFLQFQIVTPETELGNALSRIDRVLAERGAAGTAETPAEPGAVAPAPGGVGGLFESADSDSTAGAAATANDSTAVTPADTALASHPFTSRLVPSGTPGEFAVPASEVARMTSYLALPEVRALIPSRYEFLWHTEPAADAPPEEQAYRLLYLLESKPLITGEYLEDAQAQRDPQFGRPLVTFQFNREGGRIFGRATGAHVGDFMAIVLDNKVVSAPVIESQIADRGEIQMGNSTIEDARDLALVLRAGALPAPLQIVEERTIGASLGSDSIEKGELAGLIGVVFVIAIMVGYYRIVGSLAVAALAVYLFLMLGALSAVGAALTLPGVAGIVLSVGMAVDANVLIFERVREEMDLGRTPRVAMNEGFSNAMSSIVDSQITTLLTAAVLFQFGTGPVRGFAVTLSIGIIASLFTAIFVTRTFFLLYIDRRRSAQPISI